MDNKNKKILIFSKCKNIRISPYKLRLILKLIEKKTILETINILNFTNKKGALYIKKTIESAISNAENNNKINIDSLKIYKIFVDKGKIIKRIMIRAKGKFDYINKKTSILSVILTN